MRTAAISEYFRASPDIDHNNDRNNREVNMQERIRDVISLLLSAC